MFYVVSFTTLCVGLTIFLRYVILQACRDSSNKVHLNGFIKNALLRNIGVTDVGCKVLDHAWLVDALCQNRAWYSTTDELGVA